MARTECYCGKTGCLECSIRPGAGRETTLSTVARRADTASIVRRVRTIGGSRAVARHEERLARALSGVINILDLQMSLSLAAECRTSRVSIRTSPTLEGVRVAAETPRTQLLRAVHGTAAAFAALPGCGIAEEQLPASGPAASTRTGGPSATRALRASSSRFRAARGLDSTRPASAGSGSELVNRQVECHPHWPDEGFVTSHSLRTNCSAVRGLRPLAAAVQNRKCLIFRHNGNQLPAPGFQLLTSAYSSRL